MKNKYRMNIQLFTDDIDTNRGAIELPGEVSSRIIQTMQEESAVMRLATRTDLPGRGLTIPMIVGDPEPEWVDETDEKPVDKPNLDTKKMKGYTLAVIVPFSNQFRRDNTALFNACVGRLPRALAKKYDNTVFGGTAAPGSLFDTFAGISGVDLITDPYAGLVTADTNIAVAGGILNGYVISPQMKGVLLSTKDGNERPLFINSVAEGAIPMILGSRTYLSKGAYVAGTPATAAVGTQGQEGYVAATEGTPATLGVAGDWTFAMYGVVEGVSIYISDQASLKIGNEQINLWQRNMFAVRAEIEVGFRADTSKFCRLLGNVPVSA